MNSYYTHDSQYWRHMYTKLFIVCNSNVKMWLDVLYFICQPNYMDCMIFLQVYKLVVVKPISQKSLKLREFKELTQGSWSGKWKKYLCPDLLNFRAEALNLTSFPHFKFLKLEFWDEKLQIFWRLLIIINLPSIMWTNLYVHQCVFLNSH